MDSEAFKGNRQCETGMKADLQRRAEALTLLHALSIEISATRDLSVLLRAVVERAVSLLQADGGVLGLCDPEKEEVHLAIEVRPGAPPLSTRVHKYGEGAAGQVAQTGKPLLIDDYRTWEGCPPGAETHFTAVLAVPLVWQGQVTGVLLALKRPGRAPFTQADLELLSLFASQAAIAIENARLFEAERAQLLLARTLQAVGAMLTSQLGLHEVLERLLDYLGAVVHYDSASIQLFGEDGLLSLAAGRGFADPEKARQIVRELSPRVQERWKEPRLIVLPDTHADARWVVMPDTEDIRSWVGAPLVARGRFIGVLNVDSCSVNAYDRSTGNTVMAFANQAAIAIENARLFEAEHAARAQAEALRAADKQLVVELETVRRASLSLTASLELPQVLNAILRGALDLLPEAFHGNIYLYNYEGDERLQFGAALSEQDFPAWPWPEPRPNGLTYTVARTGEAVAVPDIRSHPLFLQVHPDWNGSIISLPLKIGARVVGVMNIVFRCPNAFQEGALHTLRLLGDQAAVAIENARLFQQAATERRHLRLLYDIHRELAKTLDPDEILRRAVVLTSQALEGLVGTAFLYLPEGDRLCLRAYSGIWASPLDEVDSRLTLSRDRGLEGWVIRNRKPAIVTDTAQDPRWLYVPGLGEQVRSVVCAPILEGDALLGVLTVLHDRVAAFSDDHQVLLQAICQQVGLALGNARRYDQVQQLAALLSAEQKRLESLVEHLPVGVLLLDHEYRLLESNPLGRAILEEFGTNCSEPSLSRVGPYTSEALFNRPADQQPVEIVLDGPRRRFFEVEASQVGGETPNRLLMLREVTQERDNQARIQTQERLATVGQLAAGIAHDFNNIMAAILVYTDLLMREPNLTAASRERLAIIEQQVERAASLIRQILDFSRRAVIERCPLDLLPFIKELDKMLGRVLPENIHLEFMYQHGVYWVKADPTRLQQVFMNLALNARDALPQGGNLRFELSRYKSGCGTPAPIQDLPAGEWICVSIQDTGVGIPAEVLPHIFEPFFTTKSARQGTGLGLAQVYGIIKQHEGFIDVSSPSGRGTRFTFCLPALKERQKAEQAPQAPEMFKGAGESVLLVEDDPTTRAALRDLLEAQNYRVLVAADGQEALRCYAAERDVISLVVSDLVMPEMGGVDLYHALQSLQPNLKMLFITGHPLDEESRSLLETGGVPWLQKPFPPQELGRVMVSLLRET